MFVDASAPGAATFRQLAPGCWPARQLGDRARCAAPTRASPTPTRSWARPASTAAAIAELTPKKGWWHDASRGTDDLPAEVEEPDRQVQYEEAGEFPVERGYIWTTCASVENGNPLFWDDDVAAEITGGPIAPPTMMSVWFRPHHWSPGRTEQALPAPGPLRPEGAASGCPRPS